MALGFIGATAAPGLTFAPDGSAVSLLPVFCVTLSQRAKDAPAEPPPPVQRELYLALVAPPEAADKPVVIYVRGFVLGNGRLSIDFNGEQTQFDYSLAAPPPGVDLPTGSVVDVVHQARARAGENVLRIGVLLSYAGVALESAKFDIDSVDVALDGAPEKGAPTPRSAAI